MFYLRNKKHDYLLQLNCAIRDLYMMHFVILGNYVPAK